MEITAEHFEQCTGNKPERDDLERCNCKEAGTSGHYQCGWNHSKNMPVFMVGKEPEQLTIKENGDTIYPGDVTIKGNVATPGFSGIKFPPDLDTLKTLNCRCYTTPLKDENKSNKDSI